MRVYGVKAFINELNVKLPGDSRRSDQEIAVAGIISLITLRSRGFTADVRLKIEQALERNAELEARRIGVEVDGGRVILRGGVGSWAEK